MDAVEALRLRESLVVGVLLPLASGGALRLGKAVGEQGEAALVELPAAPSSLEEHTLLALRDTKARALAPVEGLPPLAADEWRIAAALHDLVLATNPKLAGLGFGRPGALLASVLRRLSAVQPPVTLGELLARHATFVGAAALVRSDVEVRFWAGTRRFVGEVPPARILAWPKVRRVSKYAVEVGLAHLADHLDGEDASAFRAGLRALSSLVPTLAHALGQDVDAARFGRRGASVLARLEALRAPRAAEG